MTNETIVISSSDENSPAKTTSCTQKFEKILVIESKSARSTPKKKIPRKRKRDTEPELFKQNQAKSIFSLSRLEKLTDSDERLAEILRFNKKVRELNSAFSF